MSLPRSRPSEQGVDAAAVLAFVDAVDADPTVEVHSLMVLRHGHVVAEGWWAPHTPDRARLLYSLSKSFTSLALGFAVAEGLVSLDDPVLRFFPELDAEVTDPRSRATTLRHLAAMASGHDRDVWEEAVARDLEEPVRGFLTLPPEAEPGTVFAYNQCCTYTVAAALQRVSGSTLVDFLRPRLLDPLGIGEVGWQAWPAGRQLGFSGLFARTEDVAALGRLLLARGAWDGRQLLDPSYVDLATAAHVSTGARDEGPDWQQGYGFQFWRSRHGFRGDGAFGQFCLVLPDQDSVVAITAGTEQTQTLLDHVWDQLLPGLGTSAGGPEAAGAEQALADRLATLALPTCPGEGGPRPGGYDVVERDREGAAPFVRVELGDGRLTLAEEGDEVTVPLGVGAWRTTVARTRQGAEIALAVSGGEDAGRARVEVILLETPHRLDIVCDPGTGTAEVTWRDAPLRWDGLGSLRVPEPRG